MACFPRSFLVATLALLVCARGRTADAAEPAEGPPQGPATAPEPAKQPAPEQAGAVPQGGAQPQDAPKRVTYIPESVKAELREQIKQEVIAEFWKENWALPNTVPDWTKRIRLFGDVRVRYELNLFPPGNADGGFFPDFNGINTSTPFDMSKYAVDTSGDKYLNVDTNRSRFRLRARLGAEADAGHDWTMGLRISTGDGSPVNAPNQTLGGSGGYFGKFQIWFDQAYIRFNPIHDAGGFLMAEAGRFENPFFTVRDLLWSENVNLDGFAFSGAFSAGGGWRPFVVLGASPVYTTAFNYPAEDTSKFDSMNKWLFAAQLGTDWKPSEKVNLKLGAAFYYFYNITGEVSPSCDTNLKNITCSTDDSRPSFAQKGNTYIALRTPSANALAAESAFPLVTPRYEYFGLASQFKEVFATGKFDYLFAPAVGLSLEGEFAWNAGFSRTQIAAMNPNLGGPLNNLEKCTANGCTDYAGGPYAYVGRLTFGTPSDTRQGDWNASIAYLHVESDAVVDAFTNPDFGMGGTNLKGYWIGGRVAVANNLTLGVRWMSSDQIVGPTFRFDLLQVDFWGRF